jgi:hypothetical protein
MSTSGLFDVLLSLLGGSQHYMVTGSLSFLPLTHGHREPGQDLDVFIRRDVFEARRSAFERAGQLRVLRVPEVALAGTSNVSKVFFPRTGFLHLDTDEGTLDVAQYEEEDASVRLMFGLGIRFAMTRAFSDRRRELHWRGYRYSAAPPEFMFLTKAVGYSLALRDGTVGAFEASKHHGDLLQMARIIDETFAWELLRSLRVAWRLFDFPRPLQRLLNPYSILDMERMKAVLLRS